MTSEIDSYLSWLEAMRQNVRDALLGLDADGLNWKPLPAETNSVYNLAQHSAWVEQWWIGSVLAGQTFPYDWSDDQDLKGQGEDAADLLVWLDEAATVSKATLESLTPSALDELRTRTRADGSEEQLSVRWIIVHTIEHYAEHIGQMRLTRQLWEAEQR